MAEIERVQIFIKSLCIGKPKSKTDNHSNLDTPDVSSDDSSRMEIQ